LKKSNETFFDELFKYVKNEHTKEYLTINDFERAVEIYLELFTILNDKTNQTLHDLNITTFLAPELLETTRYSRYWTIPYVYAFFNIQDMSNKRDKHRVYVEALKLTEELYKYFVVQSICNEKVINSVQTFVCNTVLMGIKDKEDSVVDAIRGKINISPNSWETDNDARVSWINERLTGNIYENYVRARILCVLSAIFDEQSSITEGNDVPVFSTKNYFFNWKEHPYDLEHIYSRKETDVSDSKLYNSLGNLVVLERPINRLLGGKKDVNGYDKKAYYDDNSIYAAPKRVFKHCNEWGTKQIEDRLLQKTDEIRKYLGVFESKKQN